MPVPRSLSRAHTDPGSFRRYLNHIYACANTASLKGDLVVIRDIDEIRPGDPALSPWYSTEIDQALRTPEWTFAKSDLRRFPD